MRRQGDDTFIVLTDGEQDLVNYALDGDSFIQDGYRLYGPDWPEYIPSNINLAMQYFFGLALLPKQLQAYYCPIDDVCIHGGRGSGKTVALALSNALWTALHPGNNWLHVSPSLDQAIISFKSILQWGETGRFLKTFIRHWREAPSPTLYFKRWDDNDPGSEAQFRSIGQNPMELLRSFEAGRVTTDEAFRTQTTDGPYRVLSGMLRGTNNYVKNAKPHLKTKYDEMAMNVALEINPLKRKALQEEMDRFAEENGLTKETRMMLFGNVGAYTWEWQRFEWGLRNPDKRWSVRWTSDDNPYYTERQKDLVRRQFRDDPDGLAVEMEADKPKATGDVFTSDHTMLLFDGDLDFQAIEAVDANKEGWIWQMHQEYGLVRYAKPAEPGAVYVVGGDPGAGRVPHRNKWVNIVARLSPRPFEICYFNTGNLTLAGQGSIDPWIADAQWILRSYPMMEGGFAAEAGGTQKNVHQVVWPENLKIVPLSMAHMKAQLIMQAQLMLQRGMYVSPNIALLERELLSYDHNDRKLDQDTVMAFLALTFVVWPHVSDEFQNEWHEDEEETWETLDVQREARDQGREIRVR